MAPLPCSPVSNSTASESQSLPASEVDSDDSLTTPRPGPSDPAQRTKENLSRPSIPPGFATSPENIHTRGAPGGGSPGRSGANSSGKAAILPTFVKRDTPSETKSEGNPRNPYTYGSSPKPVHFGADRPSPPRSTSVSFSPEFSAPKPRSQSAYLSPGVMSARNTPNVSPHTHLRNRLSEDTEPGESSADENTAIFRRGVTAGGGHGGRGYGAVGGDDDQAEDRGGVVAGGYDGTAEDEGTSGRRKKSGASKARSVKGTRADEQREQEGEHADEDEHEGWWTTLFEKYGSVELENKGSVARDHLALERTFLAWLRTSLSFASIGIAVTQLFRLNSSIKSKSESETGTSSIAADPQARLRHVGKPLGATFIGISILVLLLGFHRYFESQHYVIRGKFPASRGSIAIVSFAAGALIVASLAVVLAVAPGAFEKK